MRPLFIHPGFPGSFALVAQYAAVKLGWKPTLLTSVDTRHLALPFDHLNYRLRDDVPCPQTLVHPDSLNAHLEHLAAVFRGLRALPQVQPTVVVGHLTYGTFLYLRTVYSCPFVGYFELYPGAFWNDGLVLRKEFPPTPAARLANATFHALVLAQLTAADAAYAPSETQKAMCPEELRGKLRVFPEGVDCQAFQPRTRPTAVGDVTIDAATPVVTYVSRGLESARGFDVFMKLAKRIGERVPAAKFVVVGAERTIHGHELAHIGGQSFKAWVLSKGDYDLSRFTFLGVPTPEVLAAVYNISDVHVHLTVPHVPSASLLQAMASGCAILGSNTSAVTEYVEDGVHARLAGFDDLDALTERAVDLLAKKDLRRQLGREARLRAQESYEGFGCLKRLTEFLKDQSGTTAIDQAFAGMR